MKSNKNHVYLHANGLSMIFGCDVEAARSYDLSFDPDPVWKEGAKLDLTISPSTQTPFGRKA